MSKAIVVDEIIEKAGIELESNAERVSPHSLRRIIGQGNPYRMFDVWKKFKSEANEVDEKPDGILPVSIQKSVDKIANDLNESIRKVVNNTYIVANDNFEEQLKVIQNSDSKRYMDLKEDLLIIDESLILADDKIEVLTVELQDYKDQKEHWEKDKIKIIEMSIDVKGKVELLKERELLLHEKNTNYSMLQQSYKDLEEKYIGLFDSSSDNISALNTSLLQEER
jgi:hypothetical protein